MVITLKRLIEWVMLCFVFIVLSAVFYQMLLFLQSWINPLNSNESLDQSIKVFDMEPRQTINSKRDAIHRLKLFYWLGE